MTLRYPLDVTSNQNDRLLFIADPVVQGLEDPLAGRRFELCERGIEASICARTTSIRVPCSERPTLWSQNSGQGWPAGTEGEVRRATRPRAPAGEPGACDRDRSATSEGVPT
jgi:hypothetical protein